MYSIQEGLGEEFGSTWRRFVSGENGSISKKLCKPLLTRWGYVLQCATSIAKNWDNWIMFLKGVYKSTLKKEELMVKRCLEMSKDPKLQCELQFIVAFGNSFFNKHFAWLHRIDKHSKISGFSAHEMPLRRLAIMESDLQENITKWRDLSRSL